VFDGKETVKESVEIYIEQGTIIDDVSETVQNIVHDPFLLFFFGCSIGGVIFLSYTLLNKKKLIKNPFGKLFRKKILLPPIKPSKKQIFSPYNSKKDQTD